MRSASSGSADRSAICITFSLPHENAVELQNMARSCAGRLRELGVLAVQVGNTTAISVQPRAGNTCQSVHQGGTRDRRQQALNTTRTNVAQYLGADISTFSSVIGGHNTDENDRQNNSVCHQNVAAIASMPTGVTVDHSVNLVAESSPHIVNLLQHDVVSSRSVCLSAPMPVSTASDVRPRKRARRRTPSAAAAAEVLVPLSMFGTADCTNTAYSFQQLSRCVDSSSAVPPVHSMPLEQFKVPESRRRKACTSRKTNAAKNQQLPVACQPPSNNLTNSFTTGFSECSKSSEVGMFHATASYSMGDGFQLNGVNPYHRIPVMTAGWQTYAARSLPSNNLYHSLPAAPQYPNDYGHPQFRFAGNVDYSQIAANANRMPGVGSYCNVMPGSSRWPSASESQSASVPYGSNNSNLVPNVCGVYNMTPTSHIMQRQFAASRSDVLPVPDGSKPCTETVTSASEQMVHLSISSDIDRIKNMPVCDAPSICSVSGGHVNMLPSVTYQRANGLFADVHSSALAFHERAAHVKMNGDVDCLQQTDSQALSKRETVSEISSAATVPPYVALASSVPTCAGDSNCVLNRQLQQPSVQLPVKVQQCGLAHFEDTDVNGCSASTTPDMPKMSVLSDARGIDISQGTAAMQQKTMHHCN